MFKVLGTTDDITTCDCCGKKNLKLTVVLERDDAEIVHYGSDCAAAALMGSRKGKKSIEMLAKAADFARRNIGKLSADEIHRRLSVAGWANFDHGVVWNDAGKVQVAA